MQHRTTTAYLFDLMNARRARFTNVLPCMRFSALHKGMLFELREKLFGAVLFPLCGGAPLFGTPSVRISLEVAGKEEFQAFKKPWFFAFLFYQLNSILRRLCLRRKHLGHKRLFGLFCPFRGSSFWIVGLGCCCRWWYTFLRGLHSGNGRS